MTMLSRSMLPRTLRSASRSCGGRGSSCSWGISLCAPFHGLVLVVSRPERTSGRETASRKRLFLLRLLQRHDHDLNSSFDVIAEVQLDFVEGAFLDGAFEADHFGFHLQVFALEGLGDFR